MKTNWLEWERFRYFTLVTMMNERVKKKVSYLGEYFWEKENEWVSEWVLTNNENKLTRMRDLDISL